LRRWNPDSECRMPIAKGRMANPESESKMPNPKGRMLHNVTFCYVLEEMVSAYYLIETPISWVGAGDWD
jgi:hypothetical protein